MRFVFPELRERCAKRRLHLVDVDLRWGVTEEDAEQGKVLEVCLDEIERCRPFFIGLLGERYGWVPPKYDVTDEARYDWVRRFESGHSITALEVYHGVLRDPAMHTRAFFYFRDPAFFAEVPEQHRAIFLSEGDEAAAKLRRLKDEIRLHCPVLESYSCSYRGIREDGQMVLTGLEGFGRRVLEDLWSAINQEYPEEETPPDALVIERAYHEAFSEKRSQRFIGRRELIEQLTVYADGDDGIPLVVTGAPGCGKSALLVNFAVQYVADHPDVFVLTHFIGAAPGTTDIRRTLLRLSREIANHFSFPEKIPEDYQRLWSAVLTLLERAAAQKRVVLILDALNQLENTHDAHSLYWLPSKLPPNLRLIVSALEGKSLETLRNQKPAPHELLIGPLSEEDRRQIVRETLWTFRKRLDERPEHDQIGMLLNKVESHNPLYLVVACEEMRLFGDFERVDEQLTALSGHLEELFQQVLERVESDHGRDLVERALSLLECCRQGLLENEMLELLRRLGEEELPQALWAPLYRSLQFYLRPPGETAEGALDFFHQQLAQGVRRRYLQDESRQTVIHAELASYFRRKSLTPDRQNWKTEQPRNLCELPYHLFQAKLHEELFSLARDSNFLSAQRQALPEDPSIALETMRLALQAAADANRAGVVTEFLLAHVKEVSTSQSESPLDALREGNLERAWELADLYDKERCALWHLLMASELGDKKRQDHTRETLERLQKKEPPRLSEWKGNYAESLLRETFQTSPAVTMELQNALLDDRSRAKLSDYLIENGQIAKAVEITKQISDVSTRVYALLDITRAQAAAGDHSSSQTTLAEAIQTTRRDHYRTHDLDHEFRISKLTSIAEVQAQLADHDSSRATFEEAIQTALEIIVKPDRCECLWDISTAQAKTGAFADALHTASMITNESDPKYQYPFLPYALMDIALAYASSGNQESARDTFARALENAVGISDALYREEALCEIAKSQARAGTFLEANQTASQINDEKGQTEALSAIVEAQVSAGVFEEAIKTASLIRDKRQRVYALCEIGRAQSQSSALSEALRAVSEIPDEGDRAASLAEIAASLARLGYQDSARAIIAEAIDATTRIREGQSWKGALTAIAEAQAEAGAFEEALQSVSRISAYQNREAALTKISRAQAHSGAFAEACQTALLITDERGRARALIEIGKAQREAGAFEEAVETASQIRDEEYRFEVLVNIAALQAQAGDRDSSRTTLAKVIGTSSEHTSNADGEAARVKVLCDLAGELTKAGDGDSATAVFKEAIRTTLQRSNEGGRADALRDIAEAQTRAGDTNSSRETLAMAASCADYDGTLKGIAEAQAQVADFEHAIETASQISDEYTKTSALKEIIKSAMAAGAFAEAIRAALSLTQYSLYPPQALYEIAKQQAESGAIAEAIETASQIVDDRDGSSYLAQALGEIARALAQRGAFEEALSWASLIRYPKDKVATLNDIAAAQARAGDQDSSRAAFAEAIRTALGNTMGGNWEQMDTLGEIAEAQAQAGAYDSAVQTALQITDDWEQQTKALGKIIEMQQLRGAFSEAIETAAQIGDHRSRALALRSVAEAQAKAGRYDSSRTVFEQSIQAALQITDHWKQWHVFDDIAKAQAQAGAIAEAIQTISRLDDEWQSALALKEIAKALAGVGDFVEAHQWASQTARENVRAESLNEIAIAEARAGDQNSSRASFAEAVQTALRVDDEETRTKVLNEILHAQLSAGRFSEAIQAASQIESLPGQGGAFLEIVKAQVQAKQFAEATQTALRVPIEGWAPAMEGYAAKALDAVIKAQLQASEFAEAIQTTLKFRDEWETAYELRDIVRALAQERETTSSRAVIEKALQAVSHVNDGKWRAELLYILAGLFSETGDVDSCRVTFEEAMRAVSEIENEEGRAEALAKIAAAQAQAGFPEESVLTAQRIRTALDSHLPEIAATFASLGDKEHFKRLLIPCAYYPDAADRMCRLLIQLYPEQSAEVASAVLATQ